MSFVDWNMRLRASVEALKSDCDELQRALPKTPDKLPRPIRRSVVSFLAMARNCAAKADESTRAGDPAMAWENVAHGRECAYTAALQIVGVQLAQPSVRARKAAEALHGKPGGNRDKANQIRAVWATGKYSGRDSCAEEEFRHIGFGSFSTARRALRGTPDPDPWPGRKASRPR